MGSHNFKERNIVERSVFNIRESNGVWKNSLILGLFFVMLAIVAPFTVTAECPPDCTINNPIDEKTFIDFIKRVAKDARDIVVPFAVMAIIFAGFKFVTASASGKAEETAKARKLLTWIIVGSAIIVGATVLIQAVINTMDKIRAPV